MIVHHISELLSDFGVSERCKDVVDKDTIFRGDGENRKETPDGQSFNEAHSELQFQECKHPFEWYVAREVPGAHYVQ